MSDRHGNTVVTVLLADLEDALRITELVEDISRHEYEALSRLQLAAAETN